MALLAGPALTLKSSAKSERIGGLFLLAGTGGFFLVFLRLFLLHGFGGFFLFLFASVLGFGHD